MSCRQHGYPWPSLATFPYHSSPPAGLLSYILCPHIAAGDRSRGRPDGLIFDSYYTKVLRRVLLLSLDCSTLPLIPMLSVMQGGIKYHFWVFCMTRPGIEPRCPGPLANTLSCQCLELSIFFINYQPEFFMLCKLIVYEYRNFLNILFTVLISLKLCQSPMSNAVISADAIPAKF